MTEPKYAFNDFSSAKFEVFSVNGAGSLDVKVACPVLILPSDPKDAGKIGVDIDADPKDLGRFDVRQEGDKIIVHQQGVVDNTNAIASGGGSIQIAIGNNIAQGAGASVVIAGGEKRAEQQTTETQQEGVEISGKTPRVVIRTAENGKLNATVSGKAVLLSEVPHEKANLKLSGEAAAAVAAKTVDVTASGTSVAGIGVIGGKLYAYAYGAGSIEAKGEFTRVIAEFSGVCNIKTTGTVHGDYDAFATGVGKIVHRGEIEGNTSKKSTGAVTIDLG